MSFNLEIIDKCQTTFVYSLSTKGSLISENEILRMDCTEERIKQLNEIKEEVKIYESQLNEFLQELGWTREKLPKQPKVKKEQQKVETECEIASSSSSGNLHQNVMSTDAKSIDLEAVVNLCSTIDRKRSATTDFVDLNKLKRDLKRRRVKYRTSTAPLTYTEELRELINLQMDLVKGNEPD